MIKQITQIYGRNSAVLDEVINILFYIAEADGKVSNSEVNYIKNKFNKDTNNIFRTVFFPYISISPSKQNNLEDQDLLSINNIEIPIKNKY